MLTPNVDWLRKIRAEFGRATPSPASYPSIFVSILDALLSTAPPDGVAEREAPDDLDAHPFIEPVSRLHAEAMRRLGREKEAGDALRIKHAEGWIDALGHAIGMLKLTAMDKPTPAPTEAPAAGDGGEGFTDAAFAAYNRWVSTQEMAPSGYPAFFAGAEWAAALARPAAVTDEMVEAFCLSFHGERWLKWLEEIKAQYRADAGVHLTAALAARGPA